MSSPALSHHQVETVTIANGAATSGAFRVGEYNKGSIQVPAAITGASYTLTVSNDGVTYSGLRVAAGTAVAAVSWAADNMLPLPAEVFSFKWAKIVSASNEAAARSFSVLLKG
jgi:hypothetical protein